MRFDSFVYVHLRGATPSEPWVWVGRFDAATPVAAPLFRYASSYLSRPDAFALDPINLPLTQRPLVVDTFTGLPGVFDDAGPDEWGVRVLTQHMGRAPHHPIEVLLRANGYGVGRLGFSLTQSGVKLNDQIPGLHTLAELADAIACVERGDPVSPAAALLLAPGSSLGGARPKALVRALTPAGGEALYIAKFGRATDAHDKCAMEYQTLQLAHQAGLDIANARLATFSAHTRPKGPRKRVQTSALLSLRFDTLPGGARKHYVSAYSLIAPKRIAAVDYLARVSYAHLADLTRLP